MKIPNSDDDRTAAEELGVLVKQTQAVLHQRMDDVLRPLGLSVAQYACLQALHDAPGISGSELARRVFVSRQAMNVLLQNLDERGLIRRAEQAGPRRERATVLTARATDIIDRARTAVASVADTMTARLQPEECARLLRLLGSCRDALVDAAP